MKKVIRKVLGFAVKSALIAGVTKVVSTVIANKNSDGADGDESRTEKFERKAEDTIDQKAERAKELAKTGLHKGITVVNEAMTKAEKKNLHERKENATL